MAQSDSELDGGHLDRRLTAVEQILPTLATKEDLRAAIDNAVAPLATREEMHSAIAKAVAPLATREEMRSAIAEAVAPLATRGELGAVHGELRATRDELYRALRDEGEQTRRHFDVVAESLHDDIRLLAEGQVALHQRIDDVRIELKSDIANLDRRVMRLEVARG